MFSNQACLSFFELLAFRQRRVIHDVRGILDVLEDRYVSPILEEMLVDAMKHYTVITDLLQIMLLSNDVACRRLVNRTGSLGTVLLSSPLPDEDETIHAYCVDVSFRGMCFESSYHPTNGQCFDVQITLYDKPNEPFRSSGKVVWTKEIIPGFYTAGMQFNT